MSDLRVTLLINGNSQGAAQALTALQRGMAQVGGSASQAGQDMGGMEDHAESLNTSAVSLGRSLAGIATAAMAGLGIKEVASSFLDAASTSENFATRLNVLLGSTQEGSRLFLEMADYAARVPFQYEEIMAAATQLSGVMKGGVDEIKEWMPLIGDLAAVSGLSIQQSAEQVVRMYSAGAASADLFRERGILSMLGFQAGVSTSASATRKQLMAEWKKMDSQFRDSTDAMAETWEGQTSMFGDRWFDFRNKVMNAGVFEELKGGARELLAEIDVLTADGTLKRWAENLAGGTLYAAHHMDDLAMAIGGLMLARRLGPVLAGVTGRLRAMAATTTVTTGGLLGLSTATVSVTAATRAMTAAVSLGNKALTALGGPAGLAIIGATSLAIWASNADKAAISTEDYSEKLIRLRGDMKEIKRDALDREIREAREEIGRLNLSIAKAGHGDDLSGFLKRLKEVKAYLKEAEERSYQTGPMGTMQIAKTRAEYRKLMREIRGKNDATREATKEEQKLLDTLYPLRAVTQKYLKDIQAIRDMRAGGVIKTAKEEREALQRLSVAYAERIKKIQSSTAAAKAHAASLKEIKKAAEEAAKERENLVKSGEALFDRLFPLEAIDRGFSRDMELINRLRDQGIHSQERATEATVALGIAYRNARNEAIQTALEGNAAWVAQQEAAERSMRNIENAVAGTMWAAEDAFVQFVKTGKLEFRDLVNVMIDEIIRLQFQQRMAQSMSGGLTNIFSSVAGLFGFGGSSASSTISRMGGMTRSLGGYHSGGIVGSEASFVLKTPVLQGSRVEGQHLPRFHTGIGPDEIHAILQKGEGVFTPGQMRAMAPVAAIRESGAAETNITYAPVNHYEISVNGSQSNDDIDKRILAIASNVTREGILGFQRDINRGGSAARLVGRR